MTILRMVYILGLMVLFTFMFMVLDNIFHLGITSDAALNTFITPFIIFCSLIIVIPSLRKSFSSWFLLDKKDIHQAICIPILVSIIVTFLINIYRFIPYWLGFEPVGTGSNQVTTLEDVTDIGLMIGVVVFGPFNEEFIFRYMLFAGLMLVFADMTKDNKWINNQYNNLFLKKKRAYIISWMILVNIVFTIVHGPNLLNFPAYFLPGLVDTLFFLRYGFLSAWLSHGMSNLLSGITLQIVITLFKVH